MIMMVDNDGLLLVACLLFNCFFLLSSHTLCNCYGVILRSTFRAFDVDACNGVIHVVNKVILPGPSPDPAPVPSPTRAPEPTGPSGSCGTTLGKCSCVGSDFCANNVTMFFFMVILTLYVLVLISLCVYFRC